ncbi:photosystem II reaction center protein Psb28 [Synechococcus elongatus]|uniref:Photosystem II reaction center Psb28 protein n=2 Tax=Synechococcus elongatus TaxID=32046 RepID=PSB28_SYNE7|nr:photosystem II reaction center protein Psb28 [Synechococcus elongatus]Q31ML0.1 RecName: Full=Photosystem II reaction center Psb28 protein; AltName: Full=Photosystem II 13 kDa protein; AltName: Full=Photosystem II reaction center W protein [Synechococcus elongatus PCC 7942 = FACHB-805]Q5MZB9.1 RecName: Full=Photosystem II reaction center Psb28 protein; AltName: Full=Photosystem II 13 kDa protein; AltName: Full=Photosystem II reaction center W protein [Synechococcus elongatus PCC 6301]ABB57709.
MSAAIQFTRGIDEPVVPDVRLTRSRDGQNGTATFYFDEPQALVGEVRQDITGMYLLDDEGELATREVKAKFINGQPAGLEAVYLMRSPEEWDRFMRFMQRYAEANGLGFTEA